MIYFIQNKATGTVKIGFTRTSPLNRLRALRSASADELVLLGSMPGLVEMERTLHMQFADARKASEWFHPTDDLMKFITENARKDDKRPDIRETGELAVRALVDADLALKLRVLALKDMRTLPKYLGRVLLDHVEREERKAKVPA